MTVRKGPALVRLEDLSPEQRAHVEAQLGPRTDVQSDSTSARAHGPAPKRTDGYRSKAEADYAAWLATWANVVWRYERFTVGLPGARTSYRADFTCRWTGVAVSDGSGTFPAFDRYAVEVKGSKADGTPFWRGDSRRRALDGAAELWDALRIPLFVAWKVKGVWSHSRVEVRS